MRHLSLNRALIEPQSRLNRGKDLRHVITVIKQVKLSLCRGDRQTNRRRSTTQLHLLVKRPRRGHPTYAASSSSFALDSTSGGRREDTDEVV